MFWLQLLRAAVLDLLFLEGHNEAASERLSTEGKNRFAIMLHDCFSPDRPRFSRTRVQDASGSAEKAEPTCKLSVQLKP